MVRLGSIQSINKSNQHTQTQTHQKCASVLQVALTPWLYNETHTLVSRGSPRNSPMRNKLLYCSYSISLVVLISPVGREQSVLSCVGRTANEGLWNMTQHLLFGQIQRCLFSLHQTVCLWPWLTDVCFLCLPVCLSYVSLLEERIDQGFLTWKGATHFPSVDLTSSNSFPSVVFPSFLPFFLERPIKSWVCLIASVSYSPFFHPTSHPKMIIIFAFLYFNMSDLVISSEF